MLQKQKKNTFFQRFIAQKRMGLSTTNATLTPDDQ
jgi:hypothetical protein